MSNKLVVMGLAACAVALAGCESMGTAAQSKTTQGAVMGGLLGAGTGAIIGNQTHHAGAGTAIGAGLGALGGAMMGNALGEQDRKYQQQQFPPATGTTSTTTTGTAAPTTGKVKFCPIGGETYSEDIKYCPIHGVELRYKEQ